MYFHLPLLSRPNQYTPFKLAWRNSSYHPIPVNHMKVMTVLDHVSKKVRFRGCEGSFGMVRTL